MALLNPFDIHLTPQLLLLTFLSASFYIWHLHIFKKIGKIFEMEFAINECRVWCLGDMKMGCKSESFFFLLEHKMVADSILERQ